MALQKILLIEPKPYNYKDRKAKEDEKVYGFIAQQVKEVLPEAIKLGHEFLPNIYKYFNVSNDIINTDEDLTNILSIDEKIRVIDDKKTEAYKIIEISPTHIKIDKSINGDKCLW